MQMGLVSASQAWPQAPRPTTKREKQDHNVTRAHGLTSLASDVVVKSAGWIQHCRSTLLHRDDGAFADRSSSMARFKAVTESDRNSTRSMALSLPQSRSIFKLTGNRA